MNREERIKAAIQGEAVDRVPINVWMHFSRYDQDPVSLAKAQVSFQEKYDFDFIKMMPFGLYTTQDWGAQIEIYCDPLKEPELVDSSIRSAADYEKIEPLPAVQGTWGKQLEFAQHISRLVQPHTPFVQTIFSPLTTLKKLAGERLTADMEEHPQAVHQALRAITETTIRFVKANIETGVAGFFFATQCAQKDYLTDAQFRDFAKAYDLEVMNAYKDITYFNVVHIHGSDIRFTEIANEYPANVINWHDRNTYPSLKEARKLCDKCFLGGILEAPHLEGYHLVYKSILNTANETQIQEHIREAVEQAGERHLILGPGCVADPRSPEAHIRAARIAVDF